MTTAPANDSALPRDLIAAAVRAAKLLDAARATQWLAAPAQRGECERSGRGTVSDPTSVVALDGRRLELRAALAQEAELLARYARGLEATSRRLEAAIHAYENGASA